MSKYTGRIIRSKDLVQEFHEKEMSRRRFVRSAATVGAGLPLVSATGCITPAPSDDDDSSEVTNYLVGMATGDQYTATLRAALDETVGRNQLGFIGSGDTVYLKVNSNSGDYYPYSTRPKMVERITEWAIEAGASRVIVGDRSFWGDPNTYNNLVQNGIVEAAESSGAELVVFDDDAVDWVEFSEDDSPDSQSSTLAVAGFAAGIIRHGFALIISSPPIWPTLGSESVCTKPLVLPATAQNWRGDRVTSPCVLRRPEDW